MHLVIRPWRGGGGVGKGGAGGQEYDGRDLACERQMDGLRKSVFELNGFIPCRDVPWEDFRSLIADGAATE